MPWARVDDKLHSHPKVREAWRREPASIGLHLLALSYCMDQGTEGWVPRAWIEDQLPTAAKRKRVVKALTDAGLWERRAGGNFAIHDFLEFNPSNDDISERRRAQRERVAKHRSKRRKAA